LASLRIGGEILMKIAAIVAVAQNLAIGKNGKLPWHYKSDLRFFKQTTTGNAVLMGWNTWISIGKPLPNRLNIVLSRKHGIENQPSVLLMRNREEVLTLAEYLNCDLFITGGAAVFELFKDDIERWFVTEIPETIAEADVFLPTDFLNSFSLAETRTLEENLQVKIYERGK
jgi:dihydrofolate reductase